MGGSVTRVRLLFASLALYSQVMVRDSLADLLTSVRLVAAGVASLRHGHFSLLPITLSPCISCWMFSSRTRNNVITSIWLFACLLVSLAVLVSHVDSIESSCETHVRTPQTVPWPIIALKARADILTTLWAVCPFLNIYRKENLHSRSFSYYLARNFPPFLSYYNFCVRTG